MRHRRKVMLVMIILLSVTWGCGEKSGNETEVVFWHAMGGPLGDALDELISDFNRSHPEIHIESISMGNYNALSQKIMAGILSGKIPTIAQVYSSWTSNLYDSGVIDPIDLYIKNSSMDNELDDFYPVFIRDNQIDGRLVTLPFNKSIYAYYYNRDVFEEYNIDSFPRTWSSLLEISGKLQEDNRPVTAFGVSVGFYESVLYSFGGRMLNENGEPAFYSREGVRALKFLKDLLYEYNLAELTTGFQHQDKFIAKQIYFIMGTSVSYSFIMRAEPEFEVAMAPLPKEDTTGVMIMGTNIAIFKDKPEKEKKAAWKFIRWFTSPHQQAKWAMKTGYVPVRKSAGDLPEIKEYLNSIPGLRRVWQQLYYARAEPSAPEWLFGRKVFSQVGLEPVLRGKMTPEVRLKMASREVKRVLKR